MKAIVTMTMTVMVIGTFALGACASHGPPKPNCGGTLRAINPPVAVTATEKRP